MNKKKNLKIPFNARIDEVLYIALSELSKQTNLSKTDLVELGVIEIITKFNDKLFFEGIDLKEYSTIVKSEKLRRILGKKRNEFLSKNLMMNRINIDVYKLIRMNKDKSPNIIKNMVLEYLMLREKEAQQYKNNKKLLQEIEEHKTIVETGDIDTKKLNDYFMNVVGNINLLQNNNR